MSYPEILYKFPTLLNGARSELRPNILLDWSTDIDTNQFSDAETRNRLVVLMNDVTSTVVLTDYVGYTAATRRLNLAPAVDLERSTTYRIIVKAGVLDSFGRRSRNEYNWTFTTGEATITAPLLLSPPDASVQSVFPSLSWSAVSATGTVFYGIQIDDRVDFGDVNYDQITIGTSVTPAGTFTENTTYYWRVYAYTNAATGAWSDIRSFFFGSSYYAHVSSRQEWEDQDDFGVYDTGFEDGLPNLSSWPTNLTLSFLTEPASDYSSYVTVRKKAILPRNDVSTSYDYSSLAGGWTQGTDTIIPSVGATPITVYNLTFTPSGDIGTNTRYEILVNRRLRNTDGVSLGEDYRYFWTGKYDPLYVDPIALASKFRLESLTVPDDLLYFYIYMASLEAKARYYGYLFNVQGMYFGDGLKENQVRDTTNLNSFGVLKWVEACATYNILKSILNEELRGVGRTRRLGDFTESLTADFVKAIKEALDRAADELKMWEELLVPTDSPRTTPLHSQWSPRMHDYDASIPIEAQRDDWLY